jgi:hypothetical protein
MMVVRFIFLLNGCWAKYFSSSFLNHFYVFISLSCLNWCFPIPFYLTLYRDFCLAPRSFYHLHGAKQLPHPCSPFFSVLLSPCLLPSIFIFLPFYLPVPLSFPFPMSCQRRAALPPAWKELTVTYICTLHTYAHYIYVCVYFNTN